MTPTGYAATLAVNIEESEWQARVDAIRPCFDRRMMTARAIGSCADAGYSTTEYGLSIVTRSDRLVTLAACRFADPAGTIRRYLATVAR